jgi:phosphoglycolate phosphatase
MLLERTVGPLPEQARAEAFRRFLEHYGAHCLDATRLHPGIAELLVTLRATGRSLSVLTNKPAALAERILRGLGIRDAFEEVVGGDSLPTRKPDPAGLRRVAARARAPITHTMLVGDSPIDLDTASAAGSAFCGVAWGFDPAALRRRRPARLARDVPHLRALLGAGAE